MINDLPRKLILVFSMALFEVWPDQTSRTFKLEQLIQTQRLKAEDIQKSSGIPTKKQDIKRI